MYGSNEQLSQQNKNTKAENDFYIYIGKSTNKKPKPQRSRHGNVLVRNGRIENILSKLNS